MNNIIASSSTRSFDYEIDKDIYSLLIIQKACYALMGLITCQISNSSTGYLVRISPNAHCDKDDSEIVSLLNDELLDYSLREKISSQTESVRNLILSNAFSNTKLVN